MPKRKKRPKIGWGGSKMQRLKFDTISLIDKNPINKKNSIWKKYLKSDVYGLN
jgi:hypothetical protein